MITWNWRTLLFATYFRQISKSPEKPKHESCLNVNPRCAWHLSVKQDTNLSHHRKSHKHTLHFAKTCTKEATQEQDKGYKTTIECGWWCYWAWVKISASHCKTIHLYYNKMICFHAHHCTLNKHQMQANLIISEKWNNLDFILRTTKI